MGAQDPRGRLIPSLAWAQRLQASASLLPDALTPLYPLGPAINGASPVGGMRDGESPENNLLLPPGPSIPEAMERNPISVMRVG